MRPIHRRAPDRHRTRPITPRTEPTIAVTPLEELKERSQHAQPVIHRPRLAPEREAILAPVPERDDVLADHPPIDIDQPDPVPIDPAQEMRQPQRVRPLRIRPAAAARQRRQELARLGQPQHPGPVTTNREPDRPAAPRSRPTTNAPATPTNLSLAADAQATYPVGRITRQAQDQVDPLPPPAEPAPLTAPIREVAGDSHEQLIDRLIELASDVGYQVELCADTRRADGRCNSKTKQIEIADRLAPSGTLSVLIHELAHALLALELGDQRSIEFDYASEELVVESIAFCCCQTVGLDTSADSVPYLTSWAEQAPLEVLERAVQLTGRIADRIETVLLADVDKLAETEPALAAAA
jgi:hypothetical protein